VRRTGFKDRRELSELPQRIESLEAERQTLFVRMASPEFYAKPGLEIAKAREQLAALEEQIRTAYARWTELETLAAGGEV
jgi:ATP-binding cassette subfamily F protein uup